MKLPRIICDTREQDMWHWDSDYIVKKLDTGDYSLEGYEGILCVERKGCVSEVAKNLCDKRFDRELTRMVKIPHKYIICEFSISELVEYPAATNLPKKVKSQIQIRGDFLIKRIHEVQIKYNVFFIFCENKYYAQKYVESLFKRIIENNI